VSFAERTRVPTSRHVLLSRGLSAGDGSVLLMAIRRCMPRRISPAANAAFVFVALNWRLTVAELAYQLGDSGASRRAVWRRLAHLVEPLARAVPAHRWMDLESRELHAP